MVGRFTGAVRVSADRAAAEFYALHEVALLGQFTRLVFVAGSGWCGATSNRFFPLADACIYSFRFTTGGLLDFIIGIVASVLITADGAKVAVPFPLEVDRRIAVLVIGFL